MISLPDITMTLTDADTLPREFYDRDTVTVARELLGRILVRNSAVGTTAGVIVETEGYLADDPGCHASGGKTERNSPMFAAPGTIYVYQIYGIHYCLNIVTQPAGVPEAILIRALEPVAGIQLMRQRRDLKSLKELTSGPAKLTQALDIDLVFNRGDISQPPLYVQQGEQVTRPIVTTTRIGLSPERGADLPLRFCLKDSKYLSQPVSSSDWAGED